MQYSKGERIQEFGQFGQFGLSNISQILSTFLFFQCGNVIIDGHDTSNLGIQKLRSR